MVSRVARFLRSPRLAVGLIFGIAAYGAVASLVPQPSAGPVQVARWTAEHPEIARAARSLGLFDAFASPAFLAAVLLLAVATANCAAARTRAARDALRTDALDDRFAEAAAKRAAARSLPLSQPEAQRALEDAARTFEAGRFRVARQPRGFEAVRNGWAVIGSPLFHWSLAALFVVIFAAQLTRAEGVARLPGDQPVADVSGAYASGASQGALYRGHTGFEFTARDFQLATPVGGVDRGFSAVIDVSRGGHVVASQRVFPNSALHYGALLIHRGDEWGYAPVIEVRDASNTVVARADAFLASSAVTSGGIGPAALGLSGLPSGNATIAVQIPYAPASVGATRTLAHALRVFVQRQGEASRTPVLVSEGGAIPLGSGYTLRFVRRDFYIEARVADDWSIVPVYALFVVACVGVTIALLLPTKKAWVLLIAEGDATRVLVLARHVRGDPGFAERVARRVKESMPDRWEV